MSAASAGLDPESESGPDFKFNVKLAGGAQSDSERAGKPVGPVTGGAPPRGRGAAPSPRALRRLSRTEQERHSVVRFPCQPGGTRLPSTNPSAARRGDSEVKAQLGQGGRICSNCYDSRLTEATVLGIGLRPGLSTVPVTVKVIQSHSDPSSARSRRPREASCTRSS